MPDTTRERIVDTTAELIGRQGYAATGIKQIVAAARAQFGSVYHFFPGGKQELGAEAIRTSGAAYGQLIHMFYGPELDVVAATGAFFAAAAQTLQETDYVEGCPIATVALEVANTNETLRQATAEVFNEWLEAAADYLHRGGMTAEAAARTALVLVMLLEGAFLLSQSTRTIEPMEAAAELAVDTVRRSLNHASDGRRSPGPERPRD